MPVAEPVTTLTDYALAAVSLGCALSLVRCLGAANRVSGWLWCGTFLASALAGIAGGTWHGFPAFAPDTRDLLWSVAMSGIGAATAFVVAAIHAADVRPGDGTIAWLAWGIAITAAGVALESLSIAFGRYLNENDAYHVLQTAALWCFYRCARTTRDRGTVRA